MIEQSTERREDPGSTDSYRALLEISLNGRLLNLKSVTQKIGWGFSREEKVITNTVEGIALYLKYFKKEIFSQEDEKRLRTFLAAKEQRYGKDNAAKLGEEKWNFDHHWQQNGYDIPIITENTIKTLSQFFLYQDKYIYNYILQIVQAKSDTSWIKFQSEIDNIKNKDKIDFLEKIIMGLHLEKDFTPKENDKLISIMTTLRNQRKKLGSQ